MPDTVIILLQRRITLKMRAGVMTMVIEKEKEGRADDGA